MKSVKLHIIDSALLDKRGHHYEYVRSVYDEWVHRGLPATVYCHREAEADIVRYFGAKGIFSRSLHARCTPVPGLGKMNLLVNFLVTNFVFSRDLQGIAPSVDTPDDICFFHTIDPNQLFGLHAWYRSIRKESRPRVALIFRLSPGENPETRRYSTLLYRLFFRAILSTAEGKIFFFSDSEELAGEYERAAGVRVSVLPIPHLPEVETMAEGRRNGKVRIAYLGDARVEKGYHLLPRVIEKTLARRGNVRFIVQSNVSGEPPGEVTRAIERIKAFPGDVDCIDRPLESGEYYGVLRDADIVLLPYSPDMYRARTSGILAETIAFGKPAIVPGGTWMARQVAQYGECGVVMRGYDEESLSDAIETMMGNLEEYGARARAASGRWWRFHNPGTYVDLLIGAMGERAPGG